MNSLISIITVSFNSEKTIGATIESVLSQNYKNIQYIIIDGKSDDNTLKIIKNYHMKNLNVISEPDNGMYDAINKGLELVKKYSDIEKDPSLLQQEMIQKAIGIKNAYLIDKNRDINLINISDSKLPIWIAGTCYFGRYDNVESMSESLLFETD